MNPSQFWLNDFACYQEIHNVVQIGFLRRESRQQNGIEMPTLSHQPYYMDREGTTTDGRAVKVCMKACLFSDGVVAWELRCVAETFQLKSAEASKQFIKVQLGELSEVMVLMGMGAKREMVIPNHKAATAMGADSTLHVQYR